MSEWEEVRKRVGGAALWAALALLAGVFWRPVAPELLRSWAASVVGKGVWPGLAEVEAKGLELVLAWLPSVLFAGVAGGLLFGVLADVEAWGLLRRGLDVAIARNRWGWPIVVKEHDRWLHFLIVGPTGAGKSSRILKPMIEQDLRMMARWRRSGDPKRASMGLTVIEPKGDLVADVKAMAEGMGLPVVLVDPTDPESPHFNPLEGPTETVAEITRTVLRAMFGRQEAFFSTVQQVAVRNVVRLLKENHGDDLDFLKMADTIRSMELLAAEVEAYERKRGHEDRLALYFRKELLGQSAQKYNEFLIGLRQQVEDLAGDERLARVLSGRSDVDLDRLLREGGVLLVSTALGPLGRLGDIFGMFVTLHFQAAVLRRPGNEWTRAPHVLYVDEFGRYASGDVEKMLTLARSYRVSTVMALQSTAQLVQGPLSDRPDTTFRDVLMGQARNKVVFGGLDAGDAERFSKEFGEALRIETRWTERYAGFGLPWASDTRNKEQRWTPRWRYTDLMELPQGQVVAKLVRGDQTMPPVLGWTQLSRYDLRKRARGTEEKAGGIEVELPAEAPAEAAKETLADDDFF